ncbi:4-galactosyl-N-acetylglucosaminide 3-alpha-L-fucosyltransferase 9-like [Pseudorasbora parva]|uniref:4-galactosyl-N-acetylglucosaminide 3-alpha-L-fucosyltransferase 9-like n=1 Tax=Pseudorasbora parva TaxID=51549 RepID=UPI00351F17CD
MEPQNSSRCRQNFLIAVALITCFSAIFYIYYKPTVNWLNCPSVPIHDISRNITELASSGEDPDTILLIWIWPFGLKFDLESCGSLYGMHGCRLTDDRSQFHRAHGVLFHHRDIHWDLSNMPKLPRPPHQKWVWMNMESPTNSPNTNVKDLFNLTTTYRRDSDIMVPYGRILENTGGEKHNEIPQKNKLVCWIVSNWNSAHKRSEYYSELQKHIRIETYGNHFGKYISNQEYLDVVSSCKFFLSFENSIHKDYITEKLFNPLSLGTVPVVIGPSRKNYEEFVPGSAFIHVDDFNSPEKLAEHLKVLDKNEDLYRQYFSWREHFVARRAPFGLEHACLACDHIRRNKNYRVVKDLNSWFWG